MKLGQIAAPAVGGGLAQHQGRAGRRVDLAPVMGLQHLDVPAGGVERARCLLDEHREQVDPEAHIPGLDDPRVAGGGLDPGVVFGQATCGADYMDDARLGGKRGKFGGGLRRGEVDDAVGIEEGGERVVGHGNLDVSEPGKLAGIAADEVRALPLDCCVQLHAFGRLDHADQCLAHPTAGTHHDEFHSILHGDRLSLR